jgi:hypothetical protein
VKRAKLLASLTLILLIPVLPLVLLIAVSDFLVKLYAAGVIVFVGLVERLCDLF